MYTILHLEEPIIEFVNGSRVRYSVALFYNDEHIGYAADSHTAKQMIWQIHSELGW